MTKVLDKIPLVKYDRIVKINEYSDIFGFFEYSANVPQVTLCNYGTRDKDKVIVEDLKLL
ncbi:hypothetical protein [Ruminiclostridium papyrosolvens]|uniref:hypothetical protein n=1 Tax=Ruminiclostridium papyrosolvens TaxID=29362 RepID=UPI000406E552|nr:hypothetical protein [Ruminiclostridium papyrosolvens]